MRLLTKVDNELQFIINKRFDDTVKSLVDRLQRSLNVIQRDFFTLMAQKAISVSKAPQLGKYTPFWKPLTDDYVERRENKTGVSIDKFYEYEGITNTVLSSLNATTVFGKPLVTYKSTLRASATTKNVRGKISIDIYPNVQDIDSLNEADYFKQKVTSRLGRKTPQSTPLSFRLKNFQGNLDRPFVQEYLKWWLDYKVRSLIRQVAGLNSNG